MAKLMKLAHDFDKKWRSDDVRLQEKASFSTLLLSEKVMKGLDSAGYKVPSPIQLEAIPVGLLGRDLLVQAKSGTGKTLVFTIIALESLINRNHPQVLIIAPTREIALQICDVVKAVGSSFKNLSCQSFIGGVKVATDSELVKGCQIVVGTPGRLKHLVSLGILSTSSIRLIVLDEFDVMLDPHFKEEIDYLFLSLPKDKQVIATSATCPKDVKSFLNQYFRNPYLARLNHNEPSLLGMVHYVKPVEVSQLSVLSYKIKLKALEKMLTSIQFTQCLIFCNRISGVESLCMDVRKWGFSSTYISSAKEQIDRTKAINNLKLFRCKVLITSDLTARGIDAENVDLVVNFDTPKNRETYFHRCGRAGRYGAKGVAITFIAVDEICFFHNTKYKNFETFYLPDPIPRNLIKLRAQDCATRVEQQMPKEEENSSEISSEANNIKSPEGNISGNKEGIEELCSDSHEAVNDKEKKLTSLEESHMVSHNSTTSYSESETFSTCDSKNIESEVPALNNVFGIEVSNQLTNSSSQNLSIKESDLTVCYSLSEENAFNLSDVGIKNVEVVSHLKNGQNVSEPSEEQDKKKILNSDSKEVIEDEGSNLTALEESNSESYVVISETAMSFDGSSINNNGEIIKVESNLLTAMSSPSNDEIKASTSPEKFEDAFEEKYISLRSNLNECYLKVFKEYKTKEKCGSMSDDIENILVKQSNIDLNKFVRKSKTKVVNVGSSAEEKNSDKDLKYLNDEKKDEKIKAKSVIKSRACSSSEKNILHSTPISIKSSDGNAVGDLHLGKNSNLMNKNLKKDAKYGLKNKNISATSSSHSLDSETEQGSSLGLSKLIPASSVNERVGYTRTTKQNKSRIDDYFEMNATDGKLQGARKKMYRSKERSQIKKFHSYTDSETETKDANNIYQQERSTCKQYRNKILSETKTSGKTEAKPYKDVSDKFKNSNQHQDNFYSLQNSHVNKQQYFNNCYNHENGYHTRCSDQSYLPHVSFNFQNELAFNSQCYQNCHPCNPCHYQNHSAVNSHEVNNHKTCDFQIPTCYCCCKSHNSQGHRNTSSLWYDTYIQQWKFIQSSVNNYFN